MRLLDICVCEGSAWPNNRDAIPDATRATRRATCWPMCRVTYRATSPTVGRQVGGRIGQQVGGHSLGDALASRRAPRRATRRASRRSGDVSADKPGDASVRLFGATSRATCRVTRRARRRSGDMSADESGVGRSVGGCVRHVERRVERDKVSAPMLHVQRARERGAAGARGSTGVDPLGGGLPPTPTPTTRSTPALPTLNYCNSVQCKRSESGAGHFSAGAHHQPWTHPLNRIMNA